MNNIDTKKSINNKAKFISKGTLIAFLIAIAPYLFYLYETAPKDTITIDNWLFSYTTTSRSLYVAAWYFMNKAIPLYLLIIWFFTCKHWWYHAIFIPMSMYVFQTLNFLNDDVKVVDELEIFYIIPVMLIIVPFLYFIRLKLFERLVQGIDLDSIKKELDKYERMYVKEEKRKKKNN